jgi:hypothetical protein
MDLLSSSSSSFKKNPHVITFQDIDYEGFKLFMDTYLEMEMQEELCKRLFLSFVKRTPTKTVSNVDGKVIKVNNAITISRGSSLLGGGVALPKTK